MLQSSNSQLHEIVSKLAWKYFEMGNPILGSAYSLSIKDFTGSIDLLIRSNELYYAAFLISVMNLTAPKVN